MIVLQRLIMQLMAIAFVAFFLVPIALKRHDFALVGILGALLCAYIAFNAWLLTRRRVPRA